MDPHDHEDPRRHWPERDQDAGRSGRQAEQWSRPGGDGHRSTPQGGQEHGFRRSSRQHDYTAEHHQGGGDYGSGADNEPTLYGSGASRAGYGGYGGGGSRGYGGTGGQAANGGYSGPGGGARGLGPPSGSGYGGYEGRHRMQEGQWQGRSEPEWDGRWGNAERSQQGDDYLREAAESGYGRGGGQPRNGHAGDERGASGRNARSGGHPDPDYQRWREEQLRRLDSDYESWRSERYQKFSEDFDAWRSQRAQAGASPAPAPSATPQAGADGKEPPDKP
ncbi:hypothetical protein [Acidovorax sp. FG27]|uniref:hypothetical protein n=1 Tax=Acidovorax sp. FG27 TaxID=3133652 RepID=UPI0030E8B8DC